MTQRTLEPVDPSSTDRPCVLRVERLCVTLGARTILNGLDLTLDAGDSVAVMGRSGSGKSTLLAAVLGMQRTQSGEVRIGGERVRFRSRSAARIRRERVGVIFQSGELLSELSPVENVMIAGLLAGLEPGRCQRYAIDLLGRLDLPVDDRPVAEYSGGEQQRVAVGRSLVTRPQLLVADGPTGSLDPETRDHVVEVLFELPVRFGCALLVVTHDPAVARRASRTLRLDEDGRLQSSASKAP